MTPIVVRLAGIPQGKGRPRFSLATGHAYTPGKTRSYENELRLAAQDVTRDRPPIEGPVSVVVTAAMPVPASWSSKKRAAALVGGIFSTVKPDIDNLIKALDAFNEIVWRDDKQIVYCRVAKIYSATPGLTVEVSEARAPILGVAA